MEKPPLPKRPDRREEFESLPASPFAPHFIEKVLIAIIEANPRPAVEYGVKKEGALQTVRLQRAMQALFGLPVERPSVNDLPTLVRGAQQNLWDESCRQDEIMMQGKTPKQTSISLSKTLGLKTKTQTDEDGRADYARLLERSKEPAIFEYLYWVTNVAEHPEEQAILPTCKPWPRYSAVGRLRWSWIPINSACIR